VVIEAVDAVQPAFFEAFLGDIDLDDSMDEADPFFFDGGMEFFGIGLIHCHQGDGSDDAIGFHV